MPNGSKSEAAIRGEMIARDIGRGFSAQEAVSRAERGYNLDGSLASRFDRTSRDGRDVNLRNDELQAMSDSYINQFYTNI
ncbi:MAG: hypothetical protein K1X44_00030 [Alphaproteobacteria bacterium]|nr:hypothetical protein [Alphaproteobacteria bacterium]